MEGRTLTNFRQLCYDILAIDNDIEFAGMANTKGNIIAAEYRSGIPLQFTRKESELLFMQALIRMNMRMTMEQKTGRPVVSITEYENLIRATIMIYDSNTRSRLGEEFVMILSFRKRANNPYSVINEKIVPLVQMRIRAKS
jgi:hypothetical protein